MKLTIITSLLGAGSIGVKLRPDRVATGSGKARRVLRAVSARMRSSPHDGKGHSMARSMRSWSRRNAKRAYRPFVPDFGPSLEVRVVPGNMLFYSDTSY